ncbi:hypothetical protein MKX03_027978 [Papaver bracteatum]|nr:hypothetical protein MKX03_027978 [Papaver bracteatum]
MAEPLIGFLINKLCTYVDENIVSGFVGLEDELKKMKDSFPFLKSLFIDLQKPENHGIRSSEVVKTNLVLLRELIYEVDDFLLDCQIQVYRHEESEELAAIEKVDFRLKTKRRLEEINGKLSKMEETLRTYCLPYMVQQSSQQGSNNRATSSRWTTSLPNQFGTVGLTEDVQQIKRWILPKNDEIQRVAISGMGGLGKTTLAQKVFNDKSTALKNRFKKKIWVSVSQPVDLVKIMRTILDELGIKDHSSDSIPATLLRQIKVALRKKTYLIIMDDVWGLEHGWWSQILDGLTQDPISNSCIIITTRKKDVAISMGVAESRIHKPNLLGDEDSWSLLCKVAFSSSNGICPHLELEEMGKKIAKKCGGLPLAVKAIAGLLSTKSRSLSEWDKVHKDFHGKLAEIPADSDGTSVNASLQLSYDDLPSHLKQCILCFSIYPEDFAIQTEQLVYWWAGEGFVVPDGNNRKTTIQLGYDCLYELFSRCLIEPIEGRSRILKDRLQECKMHDTVRDAIIEVAKQEAFSSFDGRNGQIFGKDTRHFGITGKSISFQPTETPNSKIRAMVISRFNKDTYVKWKTETSLPKVDTLRVLDLTGCVVTEGNLFAQWVKSQKRLTYLNLESAKIQAEFVEDLRNLQYLIVHPAAVNSVSSLRKLRFLKFCYALETKYPKGLANLIDLQELSIMLASPANKRSGRRFCELIKLHNLRVLKLTIDIFPDADVFQCEMRVLSLLGGLQVLDINVNHCKNEQMLMQLDQLGPPPSLQELYISGFPGETMPGFIKPELLPELLYLSIQGGFDLTHMGPCFWGEEKRWNLETLSLNNLTKLQLEWKTVREMMPLISVVEIRDVQGLTSFPSKLYKAKFSIWRKIEEEDSTTRDIAGSKKRKRKA